MKRLLVFLLTGVLLLNTLFVFADDSAASAVESGAETVESETESADESLSSGEAASGTEASKGEGSLTESMPTGDETVSDSSDESVPSSDVSSSDGTVSDGEQTAAEKKVLADITVQAVTGTEKIPANLVSYLTEANFLKITTRYTDGTEASLNLLDQYDGVNTWITYEYRDVLAAEDAADIDGVGAVEGGLDAALTSADMGGADVAKAGRDAALAAATISESAMSSAEGEKNRHRLYTIAVYDKDPSLDGTEPIRTITHELVFMGVPTEALTETMGLKMKVTKSKNWAIFKVTPDKTAEYGFTADKVSDISVVLDDGETVETYKLSEAFKLEAGKSYTVVLVYDMTEKLAEREAQTEAEENMVSE